MFFDALMVKQPHYPTSSEQAQDEPHEAVAGVVEHLVAVVALGYAEDGGGADCAYEGGGEMGEMKIGHFFLPMAMW
jgi:hypothetical protein